MRMVYNVVSEMELQTQLRLQLYEIGRQPLERLQPDYGQSRYRGLVARCGQVYSVHVHVLGSARSDC